MCTSMTTPAAQKGQCGIQVQYRFEATVHVKGALKRDKTTYVPFRVLVRYVSPQPYVRTASMGFAFEKKKDAKVCITASMVSSECFPGQDVVVNISLKNGSSKTIKNGSVRLISSVKVINPYIFFSPFAARLRILVNPVHGRTRLSKGRSCPFRSHEL